ncbi:Uncharacterised protein [Ectopseudomonas mendocina]|uniref:hypothetical protein n=1 Tax=Ectopseudomonas mendocina TaxID=300 RepID=UPI000DFFC4D9|nr:hypothetical protein [Pseudomonas mendocina]SUD28650.1 Uncharacterised protein [Pseudomonas mendocina]
MTANKTHKDKPWEDTLILAFRDMQWIRQIMNSSNKTLEGLAQPPSLMAKLDGNAESAAGDILAGYRQRYFLLEFKSSASRFSTEEGKSVHALLGNFQHSEQEVLIDLSERGHFLVYPEIKQGRRQISPSFLPVHWVNLMCMPYYFLTSEGRHARFEGCSESLEEVFYCGERGLCLEEFSFYLKALARASEEGGGGDTPLKAVIASPSGMFWPIGNLSDFMSFAKSVEPYISPKSQAKIFEEALARLMHSVENKGPATDLDDGFSPR